jgi:hypothetical protein
MSPLGFSQFSIAVLTASARSRMLTRQAGVHNQFELNLDEFSIGPGCVVSPFSWLNAIS